MSDTLYNSCDIDILVNNKSTNIPLKNIKLYIRDSIFDKYSQCKLIINDKDFLLSEYFAFVNGTNIGVKFDINNDCWKQTNYVVFANSLVQQNTQSSMGGDLELECLHEYAYKQKLTQEIYDNYNISDIVENAISDYKFNSTNIDATNNKGYWINPNKKPMNFIDENLLPYSFYNNNYNSPYYCFIDTNNNFNFKTLFVLKNQNPIAEYTYGNLNNCKNQILKVSILQTSVDKIINNYNVIYDSFDENGIFTKGENKFINEYPNNESKLSYKSNLDLLTKENLYCLEPDLIDNDYEKTQNGYEINNIKQSIYCDKLVITIPLNRKACAGKLIKINLPISINNTNDNVSQRYSGTYLIESSVHSWNGTTANTTLTISKQNINVDSTYSYKNDLVK